MRKLARILVSFTCLLLVIAILAPSVAKLAHAFNGHPHLECEKLGSLHIHQGELDCNFHKFQHFPQFHTLFTDLPQYYSPAVSTDNFNHYSFLSKYQKHHFELRGPPYVS